jgi:NAD(P)-dependent dehydrogenase (short-subunit alcohol dehydrogenase family)
MNELRYDGKVAIVTGGGRGLGAAYSRLLASRGATVVVNDAAVDIGSGDERTDPAGDLVRELGGDHVADTHDVVTDGAALVEHAMDALGRVDIVINNAGFAGGGPFHEILEADFDRACDVHIRGTRSVLRAAWPHLIRSGAGRVVNTSSASVFGTGGTTPYLTGKAAVFGITRGLSHEGRAVGINVNSVMPSAFTRLTALVPDDTFRDFLAANFQPEKVAPFVAWLCHTSTEVSGECFSVGAGRAGRVFLAEAPGVSLPGGGNPEDWAEHVEELFAIEGFGVPSDMLDEVVYQVSQLGGLGDGPTTSMDSGEWSAKRASST